jgi:NAD(P)-dependent dehydrogenase (short-subunit alcohol dehydrogenase family)
LADQGDLTPDSGCDAVLRATSAAGGPVEILVNNAGPYEKSTSADPAPDRWLAVHDANVLSAVRLIRRVVPGMRDRHFGRVIHGGERVGGTAS